LLTALRIDLVAAEHRVGLHLRQHRAQLRLVEGPGPAYRLGEHRARGMALRSRERRRRGPARRECRRELLVSESPELRVVFLRRERELGILPDETDKPRVGRAAREEKPRRI